MRFFGGISRDFSKVNNLFPKLKYNESDKVISGQLDIFDINSVYISTYDVSISIPAKYPYGVPEVHEISEVIIPRGDDRHLSNDGLLCLDIPHRLEVRARNGLTICDFITEILYPYLVNQSFYDIEGKYAAEEFPHGLEGIFHYYREYLNITSSEIALRVLKALLLKKGLSNKSVCPCGSKKQIKYCHSRAIDTLKKCSLDQLKMDYIMFDSQE